MSMLILENCFQNCSNSIGRVESVRELEGSMEVEEVSREKAMNEFQFLFKACIFDIVTHLGGRKVVEKVF